MPSPAVRELAEKIESLIGITLVKTERAALETRIAEAVGPLVEAVEKWNRHLSDCDCVRCAELRRWRPDAPPETEGADE